MGEVVVLPVVTSLDAPAEQALKLALAENLKDAVIIGYRQDGTEYFRSSIADGGTVMWMMERAKLKLIRLVDSMTG